MKRIFALLAFASGVFACQGVVESSAFLSRVREVVQSAKCPDGGVAISNGKDLDGDGQLSARETTSESESEACSGTAGRDGAKARVPLFRTTMTRAGDADCPTGGVRIDFGYDVAADAGPGDGVLADEEIDGVQRRSHRPDPPA